MGSFSQIGEKSNDLRSLGPCRDMNGSKLVHRPSRIRQFVCHVHEEER